MSRLEQTRPSGHGRARGLVSSRISGARVSAHTFAPPVELAAIVDQLWLARWDLRGQAPHHTHLLSDPTLNLCFEAGTPRRAPRRRLVGIWTRLWERTLEGVGVVVAVKLRPGAARAVVDVAAATRNRIVPLPARLQPGAGVVANAVIATHLDPGAESAAVLAIAAWLTRVHRHDPDTAHAVELCAHIRASPDLGRVEQLVRRSGLTERSLQRLFHAHVGAPPKFIVRRYRLQEAALRLERGDRVSLAALAAELGYADQAHLARDFRTATRMSPSEFRTRVHR
jgi:AraC-like DNA-binding protein